MNLLDLVVLACSLANPTLCQEKHILFESEGSLNLCLMQAQPYLAQWAGEHPNLRIAGYHCAYPRDEKQRI